MALRQGSSPLVDESPPAGGNGRSAPVPPGRGVRSRFDGAAVMLSVFVSGAVLLGVEIAASRVLAPFFGNSLYVWGSLIGVVLTGLAIGYWLGGVLADRLPVTRLLLGVMALGALLVLAVPFVDDEVRPVAAALEHASHQVNSRNSVSKVKRHAGLDRVRRDKLVQCLPR